jgi:epoxyqueuosine reductase
MESNRRIFFKKDPEGYIKHAISKFLLESPANVRKADGGKYYEGSLVGFASADDPLFAQYSRLIGGFHFTPRAIFEQTFGAIQADTKLTVISWVLPISEDTRRLNRKEKKFPAMLWSHTRSFGEPTNEALRKQVVSLLKRKGYRAVAPAISPQFIHHMHQPVVGFTSNWSERHAAYVSGLGTFGLCDGFITPKGKAMRLGSVVTDLVLTPSERPYPHHHANCLYFFNGTCKACAARCPGGAITEKGHDKDKCFDFMHNVAAPVKKAEYGVQIVGCGLCQTKVPCEYEIPKVIQKEYGR